jgi:hypothetical protein
VLYRTCQELPTVISFGRPRRCQALNTFSLFTVNRKCGAERWAAPLPTRVPPSQAWAPATGAYQTYAYQHTCKRLNCFVIQCVIYKCIMGGKSLTKFTKDCFSVMPANQLSCCHSRVAGTTRHCLDCRPCCGLIVVQIPHYN